MEQMGTRCGLASARLFLYHWPVMNLLRIAAMLTLAISALADGPADNLADKVRLTSIARVSHLYYFCHCLPGSSLRSVVPDCNKAARSQHPDQFRE